MKELNTYILEKLKINKNTDISFSNYNTVITLITGICNINLEKEENKNLIDTIENWVKENDIEDFKKDLWGVYTDIDKLKRICPWYDKLKKDDYLKLIGDNPNLIRVQLNKIYNEKIEPKEHSFKEFIYIYDKFLIYENQTGSYGSFYIIFVKKR